MARVKSAMTESMFDILENAFGGLKMILMKILQIMTKKIKRSISEVDDHVNHLPNHGTIES